MTIQSYRDLKVWQCALGTAKQVYELTTSFPKHEIYGLSSQMQRAAVSIASNIAEGHARGSKREFARFITIAMGSAAELETQLLLANSFGYVVESDSEAVLGQLSEIGKMLRGLQRSLNLTSP